MRKLTKPAGTTAPVGEPGPGVWISDPHPLMRAGLRSQFESNGFRVLAESAAVNDLVPHAADADRPQLVILDQSSGRDAVLRMKSLCPQATVIMLGGDTDLAHLSDAYSAGADGYLLKNISSEALITSCRLAMLGEKVFPRVVLQFLQSALSSNGTCDDHPASVGDIELSDRELAVIRSLASGHTNKIIASNLNITEATVKVNLKGILRKLGATNRTQVAIWALQNKLASNETHSYVRSPAARSDAKDLQLQ